MDGTDGQTDKRTKTYRPSNDDVPQAHVVLRGVNRHALRCVGRDEISKWNGPTVEREEREESGEKWGKEPMMGEAEAGRGGGWQANAPTQRTSIGFLFSSVSSCVRA